MTNQKSNTIVNANTPWGICIMKPLEYVENAIVQLENHLKLPITIVDHDGWFNNRQNRRIFNEVRKSHRKLALCDMVFCARCRANCRYKINNLCMDEPYSHYTVCWQNFGQIAVPLRHNNIHYGILYAGLFRNTANPPSGMTEEFCRAYKALPLYNKERIAEFMQVLDMFGRGLIDYLCEENIVDLDYDARFRKLIEYLENNYQQNISLDDVAGLLELSPAYASSFIKQSSGCNFSQLLRAIRIEHAKEMLTLSGKNLREIARMCGFSSEFHLSKVFKQQSGESPSEFRKRKKTAHRPLPK